MFFEKCYNSAGQTEHIMQEHCWVEKDNIYCNIFFKNSKNKWTQMIRYLDMHMY